MLISSKVRTAKILFYNLYHLRGAIISNTMSKLTKLFAIFCTSLALFFSLSVSSMFISAPPMGGMDMKQMDSNPCQANCNLQSQPTAWRPATILKEEDIDPQPAKPYYIAFIGVGWIVTVYVAATYLLKYLRWRPPDFIKLYSIYRF